ncbi:MAG: hypothetical protein ACKOFH_10520 [Chthoniobacterales bacterium]
MKTLLILALGLVAAVAPLSAQDDSQSQPGRPGGGFHGKERGRPHGPPFGAKLTPEEHQKLSAAREKAKDDPTVRSLHEAKQKVEEQLANAMRAAMLAADPSLGPTLDKIKEARDRAKDMRDKFESLTPEQRQQLKSARQKAKDDPAVQAAREKMRDAQGPEAKRDAAREMHEAMKAAMLKADPSLGPLLEKLGPGMMGPRPPHRRGPDGEGPDGPPPPDMEEPRGEPGPDQF